MDNVFLTTQARHMACVWLVMKKKCRHDFIFVGKSRRGICTIMLSCTRLSTNGSGIPFVTSLPRGIAYRTEIPYAFGYAHEWVGHVLLVFEAY